jgi:hypothetical protein
MVDVERIHEWRGEDVFDAEGEKVGRLYEVFYDPSSGEAVLGSVRSGLLGRRCLLVPLSGASVGRGYLRVASSEAQIRQAEARRGDEVLSGPTLAAAADVYGLGLPPGGALESYTLIERRRAEAEEARRRADELEAQALRQADDVKEAHARAEQAARQADAAEREGEEARRTALEARREAEAADAAERMRPGPRESG